MRMYFCLLINCLLLQVHCIWKTRSPLFLVSQGEKPACMGEKNMKILRLYVNKSPFRSFGVTILYLWSVESGDNLIEKLIYEVTNPKGYGGSSSPALL
jgi:hypothetical protein